MDDFKPSNDLVSPLLTDLYQLSMAYAYWKNDRHEDPSNFDLFFRKCPFKGEFTVFAGLDEALRYIKNFKFGEKDIAIVKQVLPNCDPKFYEWLSTINCNNIKVWAIPEGTIVFPREPLLKVEGPLAVCQLLETTLLTLVNFPSLIATNAVRHRIVAGQDKTLFEFGLRRAQGPDGGFSASRYSYIGGFDGTSNVLAGAKFGIPVKGTHAHALVSAYQTPEDLKVRCLKSRKTEKDVDLFEIAMKIREDLGFQSSHTGELAAFVSYAIAYPDNGLVALVDTYDTIRSGVPNFLCVAAALDQLGYKGAGIRLDSGDLPYLSRVARKMFVEVGEKLKIDYFAKFTIAASNDLNEETLSSLNQQGHSIDVFGIGTNLVTCQNQPALGCVYKLVSIHSRPCIKLSESIEKVTLPGVKDVYRLYGQSGFPIFDLMITGGSETPQTGQRVLCRHPFDTQKRAYTSPMKVERLDVLVWDNGKVVVDLPTLEEIRTRVKEGVASLRPDHVRLLNPTPYKVAVSGDLFNELQDLWSNTLPIPDFDG